MRWLLLLILSGMLSVAPMRADLKSSEKEAGKSTPVQENDLAGWKWANFVVLAAVIGYYGWKLGSPYFAGRTETIQHGLTEARRRSAEAQRRSDEVQRKLDDLGSEIELFRVSVLAGQAEQVERMRQQAALDNERIRANSAQQIETLGKNARLELQRHASRLALQLAEQRLRGRMNPEMQTRITGQFVSDLGV